MPDTDTHMLSEKAIDRGHSLVDTALNAMLMSKAFHIDVTVTDHVTEASIIDFTERVEEQPSMTAVDVHKPLLEEFTEIFNDVLAGSVQISDVHKFKAYMRHNFSSKNSLQISRNSKLWLQHMNMVDILGKFLKTETTGHWKLHLQAMHIMLPYLAGSSHNLHTKSVYL